MWQTGEKHFLLLIDRVGHCFKTSTVPREINFCTRSHGTISNHFYFENNFVSAAGGSQVADRVDRQTDNRNFIAR